MLAKIVHVIVLIADLAPGAVLAIAGAALIGTGIAWM